MNFNKVFIIDIETNGLLESMVDHRTFPYKLHDSARLWCTVIRCLGTDEVWTAVKEENTKEFFETTLADAEYIVAHNGIKFDFIALKLFGVLDYTVGHLGQKDTLFGKEVYFLDTLILSRLFNPDRYGGHSLDSWGERVGSAKTDFRQTLIDKELLDPKSPKGFEFTFFTEEMVEYCIQDTKVNALTFLELYKELTSYKHWFQAIRLETKLADYGVKRETLGFYFDKESAIACVEELTNLMNDISAEVNPLLPKKKLGKTAVKSYTPPKNQIKKDGELSAHMLSFVDRMGAEVVFDIDNNRIFKWEGKEFIMPFTTPLKEYEDATIDDLDVVKMHLIDLGWEPTEWRERDLTKDAKKQNLPYEKRIDALRRWLQSTADGKYKKQRLEILGIKPDRILSELSIALEEDRPIRVPTSPSLRVGVQKELCPNLVDLGEKVAFAKQVALYYTYRHRKSSIAGGDVEDMDFDEEVPNTGFLSVYREEDGRVPTPAIEIGAATMRYRHVSIVNLARTSSVYGHEIRSLFGCGKGKVQFGFDFSSLEARIQGHYVYKYEHGLELAKALVAEKPDDVHCFSQDTEVFTESGWKTFDKLSYEDKVMQYSESGRLEFVTPLDIIWSPYSGPMYCSEKANFSVTPNHRVYYESYSAKTKGYNAGRTIAADSFVESSDKRFMLGGLSAQPEYTGLSDDEIRLLVATQADGCLAKDCSAIVFSFVKERKVERIAKILNSLSVDYKYRTYNRKGRDEHVFRISSGPFCVKIRSYLSDTKVPNKELLLMSSRQLSVLVDEVQFWDGTRKANGDVVIDTTCESTVSFLQTACALTDRKCAVSGYLRKTSFGDCFIHRLYIGKESSPNSISANMPLQIEDDYQGYVGCVTVPSGLVLTKRGGMIVVSGNSVNSRKLGIERGTVKSIAYAILYGCSVKKIESMLKYTPSQAEKFYNDYWDAVPALRDLKAAVEAAWEKNGRAFLPSIDGRRLQTRSKHSLINLLFQSCGVIMAKYVTIFIFEELEKQGYCTDPFVGDPDVCSMIEYHDENQFYSNPKLYEFKTFETEEEAVEFVNGWDASQGQISSVGHSEKGYYVALPNVISKAVESSIKRAEELLKLRVNIGFEWIVGKNWAQCH